MQEPISPYPTQSGNSKNKYISIAVIIIIVLIGGFLLFRRSKTTDQTEVTVTGTITPIPTEKPVIDKKSVKIQVLNGTGTPGQAGTAVEIIENAGYDPDNIATDNAEEYDHTVTTIAAKDGFDEVANDIKDALSSTFDETEIDSKPLDENSEFDIVVTTGGKIFEEPTSTPAPTTEVTGTPTPTLTPTLTPTPTP